MRGVPRCASRGRISPDGQGELAAQILHVGQGGGGDLQGAAAPGAEFD